LRLLALMGGRLPDRPTAVALFAVGVIAALVFAGLALVARAGPRLAGLLLAAQAGLAVALSTGDQPLLTVASTWLWLNLVRHAGRARRGDGPPGPPRDGLGQPLWARDWRRGLARTGHVRGGRPRARACRLAARGAASLALARNRRRSQASVI